MPHSAAAAAEAQPKRSEPADSQNDLIGVSARRLKKREIDRRSQRQAREKTKSRIAHLEGIVEKLKQSDANDCNAALMRHLEDTEKERDLLSQALRNVQKAISSYSTVGEKVQPDDSSLVLKNIQQAPADDPEITQVPRCGSAAVAATTATTLYSCQETTPTITMPELMPISASAPPHAMPMYPTSSTEGAVVPAYTDDCDCCRDSHLKTAAVGSNHWRFACMTLLELFQSQTAIITSEEDMLAHDIPVRAAMEGWDTLEQQMDIPMSWDILRRIDERIFISCGPVARLAVLILMHSLLQYHRDPSPERCAKVPLWHLPRPSCQTQKHSYAISYIPWPGLRERFVFHQHLYCGNIFWKLIASCLTINWPYTFQDCFAPRWDLGVFEISPLFRECIGNIYNWQVTSDIFERFPELRSDIPCALQSARPISNSLQLQVANFDLSQQNRAKKMHQRDKWYPAATTSPWDATASLWDTRPTPDSLTLPDQAAETAPWMTSTWIL